MTAAPGTTIVVDLATGGRWYLLAENTGRSTLNEGDVSNAAARIESTAGAAWRSFTGATPPPGEVTSTGPSELTEPVLGVRGIIA